MLCTVIIHTNNNVGPIFLFNYLSTLLSIVGKIDKSLKS